jgi:hypothetical protein
MIAKNKTMARIITITFACAILLNIPASTPSLDLRKDAVKRQSHLSSSKVLPIVNTKY